MTVATSARISIPLDIDKVDVIETKHTQDGQFIITVESREETTICGVCKQTISCNSWVFLRRNTTELICVGHRYILKLAHP